MNITVAAVGTRGDVQPHVALAKGLCDAGHKVQVATTHEFEALVREQGLEYVQLSGSPSKLMQGDALQDALGGNQNPLKMFSGIIKSVKPEFARGTQELLEAAQGTDLMIFTLLSFFSGYAVAEKLGIPFIEAYVLPGRPTKAHPSPVLGMNVNLGGWGNKLSSDVLLRIGWNVFQPIVNYVRKEVLDLPPRRLVGVFKQMNRDHQPILHGYSPTVCSKPDDWPDWNHVTGYWFLKQEQHYTPPDDLICFLENGPPPVYVGFGSMAGRNPEVITKIVIEALKQTGQRGLLLTGWGGIQTFDLPEDMFVIKSAPHDWLFPQMAAVVHHGGSGTTAAGLRAGVPTIIVPFGGDQLFWGTRVHVIGAGPKPIPRNHLTVERLAAAIRSATNNSTVRVRAHEIGEKIRAEDGVGKAVAVIERYFGR